MKIMISVAHPAHVHLFKNTIWSLKRKGHKKEKSILLNRKLH